MMNRPTLQFVATHKSPTIKDQSRNRRRSSCLSASWTSPWTRRPPPSRPGWPRFSQKPPPRACATSRRASRASNERITWGRVSYSLALACSSKTRIRSLTGAPP